MGRRILRISERFLPTLLGEGTRHYIVTSHALPEDCRIVDAKMEFVGAGGRHLVILLESEAWKPDLEGSAYLEVTPIITQACPPFA